MQETVKNILVSSVKTCNLGALRHLKQLNNSHGIIKIALNPPSTVLSLCLVYPSSSAILCKPFANALFYCICGNSFVLIELIIICFSVLVNSF